MSTINRRTFLKQTTSTIANLSLAGAPAFAVNTAPKKKHIDVVGGSLGAVVILLDTLRADHVSCYGYNRPTTPAIDTLAEKGVRFTQVISPSPWTLPSVVALLAGQQPQHVLNSKQKMKRSLVELFNQAGFATAGITEGGYVSKGFNMHRGFAYYHEEKGILRMSSASKATGGIAKTFNKAKEWLEKHKDKPFFLFIHTYEPHTPYTNHYFSQGMNPGRIGEMFKIQYLVQLCSGQLVLTDTEKQYVHALYESDIHSSDRYVGEFLTFLEKIGIRSKTLVVVTSDHGEELGEHFERYSYDHGHSLKDNLLRVPLVIHDPVRKFAVSQVDAQVRLIDVIPTVADLLGVKINYSIAGRSLVDFMTAKETSHRVAVSGLTNFGPLRYSIRDGRYKFIEIAAPDKDKPPMVPILPKWQLYDLLNDPAEKTNLANAKPKLAKTMSATLHQQIEILGKSPTDSQPMIGNEELLKRLRSLGYLD